MPKTPSVRPSRPGRPIRLLLPILLSGLLLALLLTPSARADDTVDFNRDIRPLLSDRCFACHGFDGAAREADLRLDTYEGLVSLRGEAGAQYQPVVPHDPDQSGIIHRIDTDNERLVMPPPESGLSLNPEERELIRRWIEQGAAFEDHWAFVAPEQPALPDDPAIDIPEGWDDNPIDRFILERLVENELTPNPPADRSTLIRRLSFDLTGLPPTPEAIAAFEADPSPNAYEALVDELLASPHFGERMALVWLDAARYADTNGFHHDNIRTAWPYRDWVINAFNDNMPYDQFVVEQLAGDLLPDATLSQRLASAFGRMHNINDEGGALDEEYRVEAVADRIETVATVFMGLTLNCARCHDHKYDPLTQEDYYSLYAYFNSLEERGVYAPVFESARAYPARLLWADPETRAQLTDANAALTQAHAEREEATPSIDTEQKEWEIAYREERGIAWAEAALQSSVSSSADTVLTVQPDTSVLLSTASEGMVADRETITLTYHTEATDLRLIQLDALRDASLGDRAGRADNGNAVLTHLEIIATSIADPSESVAVTLNHAWATYNQPNGDFDVLNSIRADRSGWAIGGHLDNSHRTALFFAKEPFGFEGGTEIQVKLHHDSIYARHTLGRMRLGFASADEDILEDQPILLGSWFECGPFESESPDGADLYAHLMETAFGPETEGLDLDARFGERQWQHQPNLSDGESLTFPTPNRVFYYGRTLHTPVARDIHLSLGSDDGMLVYLNGEEVFRFEGQRAVAPDQNEVSLTLPPGENVLIVKIANLASAGGIYVQPTLTDSPVYSNPLAAVPVETRTFVANRMFTGSWRFQHSEIYATLSEAVDLAQMEVDRLEALAVPVLVMKELDEPTPTFILNRGAYDGANPDLPVTRRPPSVLTDGDWTAPDTDHNRLDFARWLTQPEHPLTARVQVNRLWQTIFGSGLVTTPEDFGVQSDWPTHPELLDWLAVAFAESGWDQKQMIRDLVTSATYRQSARRQPAAAEIDPDNQLLSSFPRRRLDAEMVRDQALFTSGLLVDRIGGPSVRPYQPEGLWREVSIGVSSNTQIFEQDEGEALYRRSLYTFWKRTSHSPQMMAFDAPSREFCVVQRGTTNTPMQALVLWNDEQFVEAARHLAQRTLADDTLTDANARVADIFRRCTGRVPTDEEQGIMLRAQDLVHQRFAATPADARQLLMLGESQIERELTDAEAAELAAWTLTTNAIMGLDETIVRD